MLKLFIRIKYGLIYQKHKYQIKKCNFLPMRGLRIKGAWVAGWLGKGVIYFFKALRKGLEIHQGNTVSFLA